MEEAGGEHSLMGVTSSHSDSESGSESSATPEIPSENPSSLSSQENSSVTQKAQINLEPTSSRESETHLPFKGNQKRNERQN